MRKLIKLDSCFDCQYRARGNKLAIAADGKKMNVGDNYCLRYQPARIIDVDILFDSFPAWCPLDSE
jgi:hypothetical protein